MITHPVFRDFVSLLLLGSLEIMLDNVFKETKGK